MIKKLLSKMLKKRTARKSKKMGTPIKKGNWRKGLDRKVQMQRMHHWGSMFAPVIPAPKQYKPVTNSKYPFISKARQARKAVCKSEGITMKAFRKKEKALRQGLNIC